jgi:hypothetical protein
VHLVFVTRGVLFGGCGKHQYDIHLDKVISDPALQVCQSLLSTCPDSQRIAILCHRHHGNTRPRTYQDVIAHSILPLIQGPPVCSHLRLDWSRRLWRLLRLCHHYSLCTRQPMGRRLAPRHCGIVALSEVCRLCHSHWCHWHGLRLVPLLLTNACRLGSSPEHIAQGGNFARLCNWSHVSRPTLL